MKKNTTPSQPELTPVKKPDPPTPPEKAASFVIEYQPRSGGGAWKVERWEALRAEMGELSEAELPDWHGLFEQPMHARAWLVLRRVFGICPVLIPLKADPEDFRVWTRAELAESLGWPERAIAAELDAARGAWKGARRKVEADQSPPAAGEPLARAEFLVLPEDVLKQRGFALKIFERGGRSREENRQEMEWFAARVTAWDKLFSAPLTERSATQALYTEMKLRRAESDFWELEKMIPEPGIDGATIEKRRKAKAAEIHELQTAYNEQLARLQEDAPWFNVTGRQMNVTGCLAEMIKAVQEYEARGDKRLIDGIHTALEIQVALQTSVQQPLPRYRLGWVAVVNEAKAWLWNAEAKSQFTHRDLAMMDHAFQEAIRQYKEKQNLPVPDLTLDGLAGEYEALHVPSSESENPTHETKEEDQALTRIQPETVAQPSGVH